MNRAVCFVGHRSVPFYQNIYEKIFNAIQNEIEVGCRHFMVGSHGEFDEIALNVCREFRNLCSEIEIEVVVTSLHKLDKQIFRSDDVIDGFYMPYSDVKTVMFDIEEEYFKRQIVVSNQRMIDTCDTLICFVDESKRKSGAKMALNYAKKKGKKIVNLFSKEDEPTYNMLHKEKLAFFEEKLKDYKKTEK